MKNHFPVAGEVPEGNGGQDRRLLRDPSAARHEDPDAGVDMYIDRVKHGLRCLGGWEGVCGGKRG